MPAAGQTGPIGQKHHQAHPLVVLLHLNRALSACQREGGTAPTASASTIRSILGGAGGFYTTPIQPHPVLLARTLV